MDDFASKIKAIELSLVHSERMEAKFEKKLQKLEMQIMMVKQGVDAGDAAEFVMPEGGLGGPGIDESVVE